MATPSIPIIGDVERPARITPGRREPTPYDVPVPASDAARPIPLEPWADRAPAESLLALVPLSRSERLNRFVNTALASLALLVLSPLLLVIALAISLSSPGPIVYTQARVGRDRRRWRPRRRDEVTLFDRRVRDLGGAPFRIYKFRTMRVDAEARSGAVWATSGDPRVTPLGRFLRKSRIDELPQLFNVVLGDMNIVGPRPERPSIFARLCQDITEYPVRQRAKPGITGWAQINHHYDTSIEDVRHKVRYDLEYLRRQSLAEDFKIMLKTVPTILFQQGGW